MSLASRLPYDHAFAGGYPGIGSQPLPTDADALDYLSRVKAADGAGVEVGVATAVSAFFRDAKESGVFPSLKACCILAGARTLAGALVPVVGDAPTNVADGFVEGDFSRTSGLTGDGTSYIDSGRANDDDPQNDSHLAAYQSAASAGVATLCGLSKTSSPAVHSNILTSVDLLYSRINNSTTAFTAADGGSGAGLFSASRSAAANYTLRNAAGDSFERTITSASPAAANIFVFALNEDGSAEYFHSGTIAFYSIGTSLSLEDLDTAVTNLINAIGEAL